MLFFSGSQIYFISLQFIFPHFTLLFIFICKMVRTHSQQIGDPRPKIIHIIPGKNDKNPLGGIAQNQQSGGTLNTNHGVGHSHERTYTMIPFDSNYQDKDVSSQSKLKKLTRLRLGKEVLIEMVKEQIAANSRQPLGLVYNRDHMSRLPEKKLSLTLMDPIPMIRVRERWSKS